MYSFKHQIHKKIARELRFQGLSYSEIIKKTNFPLTSIARWVRDVELNEEQIKENKIKKQTGGRKYSQKTKRKMSKIKKDRFKRLGYINTIATRKKISQSIKNLQLFGSRNPCYRGGRVQAGLTPARP